MNIDFSFGVTSFKGRKKNHADFFNMSEQILITADTISSRYMHFNLEKVVFQ